MVTRDFSGIKNNGALPDPASIEIPADAGELLSEYVDSTGSQLEELEKMALLYESSHYQQETAAAIRRILHKIKGESAMVGIEDINELCHQTEDAFEELAESKRVDMLLRYKDWVSAALQRLAE